MAITKIDDIDLYVGLTTDAQTCWEMKKFLTDNNIKFRTMMYADDAQHEALFTAVSTWWEDVTFDKFPFLTYTEIDSDVPPSQYPRKFAKTVADLQTGDFVQLAVKNT
jgi:hypothetical protein